MDRAQTNEIKGRSIETLYGIFEAKKYEIYQQEVLVGARITLTFMPKPSVPEANQPIGLLQTAQLSRSQATLQEQYEDEPSKFARMTHLGTYIDQHSYVNEKGQFLSETEAKTNRQKQIGEVILQTNPIYNATNTRHLLATTFLENTGQNECGCIYKPGETEPARLIDSPYRPIFPKETITHVFETVAFTLTKPYRYLGSITWGYTATAGQNIKQPQVSLLPFEKSSDTVPTEEFLEAAKLWNEQKVIDYVISEKVFRIQIPTLFKKKEVSVENIEAIFIPEEQDDLFKGIRKEYLTKKGEKLLLSKIQGGIYTFLIYPE